MTTGIRLNALIATILFLLVFTKADFKKEFLGKHNEYRAMHDAPPLALNKGQLNECEAYAQYLAYINKLEHSIDVDFGENLCFTTKDPITCASKWYDESKKYNFTKGKFSTETGHFTQLVWKGSTSAAFGKAKSPSGVHYVVARYFPAGNIEGKFAENVLRKNSAFRSSNLLKATRLLIWLLPALLLQEFIQK